MSVLWPHQRAIIARALDQYHLLIAADMGTGKSRCVVEVVRDDDLVLIICPVAVGPAWQKQFASWDPRRVVHCAFDGTAKKRLAAVAAALNGTGPRALVLNYDWFWRSDVFDLLLAARGSINAIVADECHRAKAPAGKASRALYRLAQACPKARRLGLTGTPMPHSPADIYAQARFVDSSIYGTNNRSFLSNFFDVDPMYRSKIIGRRHVEEFNRRLDRLAIRVRADDVLDLPEAVHTTISVQLPAAVMGPYGQVRAEIAAEVAGGLVTTTNALTRLLRLRQMTSSFVGTDLGLRSLEDVPSKVQAIEDWLADLPADEPVAVFCLFTEELRQLRAMCERIGRSYAELSGREKTLFQFQAGDANFIGVQLAAGGVGVDLTACGGRPCRYVAYMSVGFSLGDYEQSLARVRRPGQTSSTVWYYHLVASGTIDSVVYNALRAKRDVVESVLAELLPHAHKEHSCGK